MENAPSIPPVEKLEGQAARERANEEMVQVARASDTWDGFLAAANEKKTELASLGKNVVEACDYFVSHVVHGKRISHEKVWANHVASHAALYESPMREYFTEILLKFPQNLGEETVAGFTFVDENMSVTDADKARADFLNVPQDERVNYLAEHQNNFFNEWRSYGGREQALASAEALPEKLAKRLEIDFVAYTKIPAIADEYDRLAKSALADVHKELFGDVTLTRDIKSHLAEFIGTNKSELVVEFADKLKSFKEQEVKIKELEEGFRKLGGEEMQNKLQKEVDVLTEQVNLYENAAQASLLTPVKIYTKTIFQKVQRAWEWVRGENQIQQEVESAMEVKKQLDADEYRKVFDAAREKLVDGGSDLGLSGDDLLGHIRDNIGKVIVDIHNENVRESNARVNENLQKRSASIDAEKKKAAALAEVERRESLDTKELSAWQALKESLNVIVRPLGNPYRKEIRQQLEKVKKELSEKDRVKSTIDRVKNVGDRTKALNGELRTELIQGLGLERYVYNGVYGALKKALSTGLGADYVKNISSISRVVEAGSKNDGLDIGYKSRRELEGFDERGQFADSIVAALREVWATGSNKVSGVREKIIGPLRAKTHPVVVEGVVRVLEKVLSDKKELLKSAAPGSADARAISDHILCINAVLKDAHALIAKMNATEPTRT